MTFCEEPAPKVSIPADFGVELLGDPNHSNISFNLRDNQQIHANSVIISLNSPVLQRLISDLCFKTIEVDDFQKDAVQCFLEGCYSGRLAKINKDIFRDVNKMSHVFKVNWMEKRCASYFCFLTENIPDKYEFRDLLYLFEEACFAARHLKIDASLNVITSKLNSSASYRKCFVPRFLDENAGNLDDIELNGIVKASQRQPELLVSFVISQLKVGEPALSKEAKFFLQNINISRCFRKNPDLQKSLIEQLDRIESPSAADYKLVLSLYKSCNTVVEKYCSLHNTFNSFNTINKFTEFSDLLEFLKASPDVRSFNMFFEAVFCWLFNNANSSTKLPTDLSDHILEMMTKNGWRYVASHLVNMLIVDGERFSVFQSFENAIRKCKAVSSDGYEYITSSREYEWEDLLFKENDVEFVTSQNKLSPIEGPCPDNGDCGFIIHITPSKEEDINVFNIQLLQDPAAYPSHLHFHEDEISIENMHFALEMTFSGKKRLFPVSWYGKPNCNVNGSIWKWGAIYFIDKGETPLGFSDENIDWRWGLGRQAKITPAFLIQRDRST